MLAPLLLLAALATAPAGPTTAPVAAPADPCDGIRALPEEPRCGDSPLCSARERVALACQVREAMEKRYVFIGVKGTLLAETQPGFDARRQLRAWIEAERAIAREDDPLRFLDRLRGTLGAFRDGHLLTGTPVRLPQVSLGVAFRLVGGRVFVASRERKLVSWVKTTSGPSDLDDLLAVGTEVLEIDGRPAAAAVEALAALVPASSAASARERAVDALGRRDFAYPDRRTANLTVAVAGARRTVELPWWVSPDAQGHVMARAWLRRTGIATTELLDWRYDAARDAWDREPGSARGYLRNDTILPARDAAALREWADEGERPAVRMGEVVRRRDRAFCYLQILTFQTETLTPHGARDGRDGRRPFAEVIDGFIRECKEKELDLVLDLRQNGGGFIAHSSALVASLGERRRSYPGGALLLRASTLNQLVFQQRAPAMGAVAPRSSEDALEPTRVAGVIGEAQRAGRELTPAFLEPALRASEAVGGFPGKVVALVGPGCTSACERAAGLLRRSGRAVLVGGPTEGAGGSQQEARNLSARWTDAGGLLWLSIPNAAMGLQGRVRPAAAREVEPDAFFAEMAFENRPVPPHVPYATTLADLTGENRGWLEQAEAAIFSPAGARAASGER